MTQKIAEQSLQGVNIEGVGSLDWSMGAGKIVRSLEYIDETGQRALTLPELIYLRNKAETPNLSWGFTNANAVYTGTEIFSLRERDEVYVSHGLSLHTPLTTALSFSASREKVVMKHLNDLRRNVMGELEIVHFERYLKDPQRYLPGVAISIPIAKLPTEKENQTLADAVDEPFIQVLFGGKQNMEDYLQVLAGKDKKIPDVKNLIRDGRGWGDGGHQSTEFYKNAGLEENPNCRVVGSGINCRYGRGYNSSLDLWTAIPGDEDGDFFVANFLAVSQESRI